MRKKGFFVVIDGIDGSGKGTQTLLLLKKLKQEKYQTAYFDYPNYNTFFGKMTGEYLMGEYGLTHPRLASLLYALNRWEDKEKITQALKEGKVVVANRYVSANLIHQAGRIANDKVRRETIRWLEELEFNHFKLPEPDLVLFLDVPVEISQKLIDYKDTRAYTKGKKKDEHEKDWTHQENARAQALRLTRHRTNWQKIPCTRKDQLLSPEKIAELVWQKVQTLL